MSYYLIQQLAAIGNIAVRTRTEVVEAHGNDHLEALTLCDSKQGTLTLRTARDGDRVLVEVCDTGPGVPPELRQRVFEPFFTTKPVGEGTGLGLDISYRIVVNRHGGDITLTSRPGETRFQVRLPLTEPPSN